MNLVHDLLHNVQVRSYRLWDQGAPLCPVCRQKAEIYVLSSSDIWIHCKDWQGTLGHWIESYNLPEDIIPEDWLPIIKSVSASLEKRVREWHSLIEQVCQDLPDIRGRNDHAIRLFMSLTSNNQRQLQKLLPLCFPVKIDRLQKVLRSLNKELPHDFMYYYEGLVIPLYDRPWLPGKLYVQCCQEGCLIDLIASDATVCTYMLRGRKVERLTYFPIDAIWHRLENERIGKISQMPIVGIVGQALLPPFIEADSSLTVHVPADYRLIGQWHRRYNCRFVLQDRSYYPGATIVKDPFYEHEGRSCLDIVLETSKKLWKEKDKPYSDLHKLWDEVNLNEEERYTIIAKAGWQWNRELSKLIWPDCQLPISIPFSKNRSLVFDNSGVYIEPDHLLVASGWFEVRKIYMSSIRPVASGVVYTDGEKIPFECSWSKLEKNPWGCINRMLIESGLRPIVATPKWRSIIWQNLFALRKPQIIEDRRPFGWKEKDHCYVFPYCTIKSGEVIKNFVARPARSPICRVGHVFELPDVEYWPLVADVVSIYLMQKAGIVAPTIAWLGHIDSFIVKCLGLAACCNHDEVIKMRNMGFATAYISSKYLVNSANILATSSAKLAYISCIVNKTHCRKWPEVDEARKLAAFWPETLARFSQLKVSKQVNVSKLSEEILRQLIESYAPELVRTGNSYQLDKLQSFQNVWSNNYNIRHYAIALTMDIIKEAGTYQQCDEPNCLQLSRGAVLKVSGIDEKNMEILEHRLVEFGVLNRIDDKNWHINMQILSQHVYAQAGPVGLTGHPTQQSSPLRRPEP
jgi:hypothetical protein